MAADVVRTLTEISPPRTWPWHEKERPYDYGVGAPPL